MALEPLNLIKPTNQTNQPGSDFGGLVVRSRGRRALGSKPDSIKEPVVTDSTLNLVPCDRINTESVPYHLQITMRHEAMGDFTKMTDLTEPRAHIHGGSSVVSISDRNPLQFLKRGLLIPMHARDIK
ncbi:hypothetical protein AVEN_111262-1 [Araneus ventricosus]|uniref:Uncharacterized protein n=1 Tax=Araneus ventricosus TaxID=182803 RepID=A0A4Y2UCL1_ARAVE|nr:hypothetical protein AVEN_111262-1 [Araneus ventricosus]